MSDEEIFELEKTVRRVADADDNLTADPYFGGPKCPFLNHLCRLTRKTCHLMRTRLMMKTRHFARPRYLARR